MLVGIMQIDLPGFIERYSRIVSEETVRQKAVALRDLMSFAKGRDITPILIQEWIDAMAERGLSDGTINTYYSALKMYDKMMRCGLKDELEDIAYMLPTYYRGDKIILTEEEVRSVIEHATSFRDSLMFALMYGHARRVGEVCRIKVDDYDKNKRVMTYLIEKKKRTVTFRKTVEDFLHNKIVEYLKGEWGHYQVKDALFPGNSGPITTAAVRWNYKRACHFAGLTGRHHPHELRHARATHLIEIYRVPPKQVQTLLQHESITTTMDIYDHVMPDWEEEIPDVGGVLSGVGRSE